MGRYFVCAFFLSFLFTSCFPNGNAPTNSHEAIADEQPSPTVSATMAPELDQSEPEPVQLTQSNAENGQASWSPDGSQIAFVSNRSGTWEVWIMAVDSGEVRQITNEYGPSGWPTWSPDGSTLLFYAGGSRGYQIFSVDLSTLEIMPFQENIGDDFRPLLDAEGNRMLFDRVAPDSNNHDLYYINLETGQLTQLTSDPAYDSDGRWSPNGEKVVFHSDRGRQQFHTQVYLLQMDSGELTKLTEGPAVNGYPAWSPDGTQIVYTSEEEGNRDLWVMDADGNNKRQLTFHGGFDGDPVWSPDGNAILFTTDRFGAKELALLNLK